MSDQLFVAKVIIPAICLVLFEKELLAKINLRVNLKIVTREVREKGAYRILAVGKQNDNGHVRCPTLDFFHDNFDTHKDAIEKLTAQLDSFQEFGPPHDNEKFKKLKGNSELYEFRAGELRLFCFIDGCDLVICTNGFVKKKQATDSRFIDVAVKLKTQYFEAKINDVLLHIV